MSAVGDEQARTSDQQAPPQDEPSLHLLQIVNTLATSDGGPARNAWDLFDAFPVGIRQGLVWMHGARQDSLAQGWRDGPRSSGVWGRSERHGLRRLFRALAATDVVVIHGYYLWWTTPVAVAAKIMRKRILLTPHGALTAYQQGFSVRKKQVFEATVGWLLRASVDRFVTGSNREKAELRERFPTLDVAMAGVGTPLRTAPIASQTWRRELCLLSVSRIAPKKRLDLAIRAVAALVEQGDSAVLTIAGNGEDGLIASLKQLSQDLGLQDRVMFLGQQDSEQVTNLFRTADIFLAPSDDENFGIASAEAIAAGLPIIASRAVDALDGIEGNFVVKLDSREPAAIAEAAQWLRSCDRAELVRGAFAASRRFGWPIVAERWLELMNAPESRR
ncbi:glycosyltransferase family 4 protein [Curtobacterium sp. ER1/6]|uniref:glycosyltransferase family 4 protein n=1 Tax=Curtobacterium sp. ER1/6 TaxID=1891920 RepID=UPI0009F37E8C|nr:glycosyltransferase family 4 protein [Curtobacterium sp. ER1/6]